MKISAAVKEAFRVYFDHFGASLKFLIVEACFTLAACAPLLFLTEDGMKPLALLAVPVYLLLVLWARVNAAGAMRDALNGGSLFSFRVAEPDGYGKKLLYGLKRLLMLLLWSAPLIACLIIAKNHLVGVDGFTLLKMVRTFGGGNLMTGMLYMILILVGTLILIAVGCAFHCGDRHAFVRGNPKLVKGHHGKIMLSWVCSLITLLPLIAAIVVTIFRYVPVLQNMMGGALLQELKLPSTKTTVIILAVGAVLSVPLLPVRSLIPAAYVNGLEKE